AVPRDPHPPALGAAGHLAEHGELVATTSDQATDLARPKRSAAAQQEDSLEEASFAGAVRTEYVGQCWIEPELRIPQAPQRRDMNSAQRQRILSSASSEAHRHDDKLRPAAARLTDQTTRVAVRNAQLDLVAIDRGKSVQEVIDVEPDLHGIAAVFDLEGLHG